MPKYHYLKKIIYMLIEFTLILLAWYYSCTWLDIWTKSFQCLALFYGISFIFFMLGHLFCVKVLKYSVIDFVDDEGNLLDVDNKPYKTK